MWVYVVKMGIKYMFRIRLRGFGYGIFFLGGRFLLDIEVVVVLRCIVWKKAVCVKWGYV